MYSYNTETVQFGLAAITRRVKYGDSIQMRVRHIRYVNNHISGDDAKR